MTYETIGDIPVGELKHYGVKGMKWGVRKDRTLKRNKRVASGKGSVRDKVRVLSATTPYQLISSGGKLAKVAEKNVSVLSEQKARIERGEATVRDKLERYLTTPVIDLIRNR